MFVVFAVYVESSTEDSVDVWASWSVSAGGQDPCIVLGEMRDSKEEEKEEEEGDRRLLHVYSLHEDGHHVEQWRSDLPQHVTAYCRKAVTAAGDVLLQEYNSTTFLVNRHRVLDSWEQEGELIGCLSPRRVVYRLWRKEERDCQLIVREEDGSLSAAEQTWRRGYLSVCGDEDKIAVTERNARTLSILSTQSNSQHTPYTSHHNSQQLVLGFRSL